MDSVASGDVESEEEAEDVDAKGATGAAADKVKDLGAFIREQRTAAQKSVRNLASEAGVSNPYLSQIERGLRNPSAEILQSIARALRISAETLYVKAGILDEREERGTDLAEAIRADPHLSESQKRSLLEVYQSFRRQAGVQELHPSHRPDREARPSHVTANERHARRKVARNGTGRTRPDAADAAGA